MDNVAGLQIPCMSFFVEKHRLGNPVNQVEAHLKVTQSTRELSRRTKSNYQEEQVYVPFQDDRMRSLELLPV